jgi:fimbrial chaperone protein
MHGSRTALAPIAWLAALICAGIGQAEASSLQLEPVAIHLTPTSRSAVMQLKNSGKTPVQVQVRAFRWDQANGEDQLSPTDQIRISPPIQAIAPGGEQFVRILLDEKLSPQSEASFRLIVDELPSATTADGQVRMLIRYSVPVTVRPAGLTPPELHFRLRQELNAAELVAENTGGQSAQLADLHLTTSDGHTIRVNSGLLGYVLPGQARHWLLTLPPGTGSDRPIGITAKVDGKAGEYPIEGMR